VQPYLALALGLKKSPAHRPELASSAPFCQFCRWLWRFNIPAARAIEQTQESLPARMRQGGWGVNLRGRRVGEEVRHIEQHAGKLPYLFQSMPDLA